MKDYCQIADVKLFDTDIIQQYRAFVENMPGRTPKDYCFLTVRELMHLYDLPHEKRARVWGRVASLMGVPRS